MKKFFTWYFSFWEHETDDAFHAWKRHISVALFSGVCIILICVIFLHMIFPNGIFTADGQVLGETDTVYSYESTEELLLSLKSDSPRKADNRVKLFSGIFPGLGQWYADAKRMGELKRYIANYCYSDSVLSDVNIGATQNDENSAQTPDYGSSVSMPSLEINPPKDGEVFSLVSVDQTDKSTGAAKITFKASDLDRAVGGAYVDALVRKSIVGVKSIYERTDQLLLNGASSNMINFSEEENEQTMTVSYTDVKKAPQSYPDMVIRISTVSWEDEQSSPDLAPSNTTYVLALRQGEEAWSSIDPGYVVHLAKEIGLSERGVYELFRKNRPNYDDTLYLEFVKDLAPDATSVENTRKIQDGLREFLENKAQWCTNALMGNFAEMVTKYQQVTQEIKTSLDKVQNIRLDKATTAADPCSKTPDFQVGTSVSRLAPTLGCIILSKGGNIGKALRCIGYGAGIYLQKKSGIEGEIPLRCDLNVVKDTITAVKKFPKPSTIKNYVADFKQANPCVLYFPLMAEAQKLKIKGISQASAAVGNVKSGVSTGKSALNTAQNALNAEAAGGTINEFLNKKLAENVLSIKIFKGESDTVKYIIEQATGIAINSFVVPKLITPFVTEIQKNGIEPIMQKIEEMEASAGKATSSISQVCRLNFGDKEDADLEAAIEQAGQDYKDAVKESEHQVEHEMYREQLGALTDDVLRDLHKKIIHDYGVPTKFIRDSLQKHGGLTIQSGIGYNVNSKYSALFQLVLATEESYKNWQNEKREKNKELGKEPNVPLNFDEIIGGARVPVDALEKALQSIEAVKLVYRPVFTEEVIQIKESELASVNISLNMRPQSEITLQIENEDPSVATLSPSKITFTPDDWQEPQKISIEPLPSSAGNTTKIQFRAKSLPEHAKLSDEETIIIRILGKNEQPVDPDSLVDNDLTRDERDFLDDIENKEPLTDDDIARLRDLLNNEDVNDFLNALLSDLKIDPDLANLTDLERQHYERGQRCLEEFSSIAGKNKIARIFAGETVIFCGKEVQQTPGRINPNRGRDILQNIKDWFAFDRVFAQEEPPIHPERRDVSSIQDPVLRDIYTLIETLQNPYRYQGQSTWQHQMSVPVQSIQTWEEADIVKNLKEMLGSSYVSLADDQKEIEGAFIDAALRLSAPPLLMNLIQETKITAEQNIADNTSPSADDPAQSSYSVLIQHIPARKKLAATLMIKKISGKGLAEIAIMMKNLPMPLKEDIPKSEAESLLATLKSIGIEATIE